MKKRNVSIILIISIIMTIFTTNVVSAETVALESKTFDDFRIISSEQKGDLQIIEVEEKGIKSTISILEDENQVKTSLINNDTGEIENIKMDKSTNMMYSSITGKTIDFSDEISNIEKTYANEGAMLMSTSAPPTKTLKISYYKLYQAVGKAATVTGIASIILTIVGAAVSWPLLTTVGLLITNFSYILTMIETRLNNGSKSKTAGVEATATPVKYTKHQAGQVFTTYKYKVSIARY